jgi:hypothetical protein
MTFSAFDEDLDEPTIACRYMLYSESQEGGMRMHNPLFGEDEPPPESETRRWVLVKRPSSPPSALDGTLELPDQAELVRRVLRSTTEHDVEIDDADLPDTESVVRMSAGA